MDAKQWKEKLMASPKNGYARLAAGEKEAIEAYTTCYRQVAGIIKQEDNPYREQIIKHLFTAYYYGLGYYVHTSQVKQTIMTSQQAICDKFITLVYENFKEHRDISFYADKLCVSNKYLSCLLKQETGLTALAWIEINRSPFALLAISAPVDIPPHGSSPQC